MVFAWFPAKAQILAQDIKGVKKDFIIRQQDVESVRTDEDGYIIFQSGRTFEDPKHYLWPIPLQQRDRNPNLTQNQGW
jgi:starch-binding outer membrane protein, SusD/RagB family